MKQRLRDAVATILAPARVEVLRILTIRDEAERAREIGALHGSGIPADHIRTLIDAEEDPALRAVLVGMLREGLT